MSKTKACDEEKGTLSAAEALKVLEVAEILLNKRYFSAVRALLETKIEFPKESHAYGIGLQRVMVFVLANAKLEDPSFSGVSATDLISCIEILRNSLPRS